MKAQEKDRIQNAIRHIESSLDVDPWARDIAVDAMERQVPLKHLPYEMGPDGAVFYPCGNCGEDVKGYDYCPWCGQKVGK